MKTPTKAVKLTIDRIRWLVGESPGVSELFRERDGKLCCMGFYCMAKGATLDEIKGEQFPYLVDGAGRFCELATLLPSGQFINAPIVSEITRANDSSGEFDDNRTLAQREARLTELFKQIGIEVEFIN